LSVALPMRFWIGGRFRMRPVSAWRRPGAAERENAAQVGIQANTGCHIAIWLTTLSLLTKVRRRSRELGE